MFLETCLNCMSTLSAIDAGFARLTSTLLILDVTRWDLRLILGFLLISNAIFHKNLGFLQVLMHLSLSWCIMIWDLTLAKESFKRLRNTCFHKNIEELAWNYLIPSKAFPYDRSNLQYFVLREGDYTILLELRQCVRHLFDWTCFFKNPTLPLLYPTK
jgi:hypothetical protein